MGQLKSEVCYLHYAPKAPGFWQEIKEQQTDAAAEDINKTRRNQMASVSHEGWFCALNVLFFTLQLRMSHKKWLSSHWVPLLRADGSSWAAWWTSRSGAQRMCSEWENGTQKPQSSGAKTLGRCSSAKSRAEVCTEVVFPAGGKKRQQVNMRCSLPAVWDGNLYEEAQSPHPIPPGTQQQSCPTALCCDLKRGLGAEMWWSLCSAGQGGSWMIAGEDADLLCGSAELTTSRSVCIARSTAGGSMVQQDELTSTVWGQ